ncbi:hypothetical protein [Paenibacillus pinistramenti]|uniref:hypothetical protein n=1 Tax=Paenibacillus pinistramenti TaxID=1768003 RepID=UPI0011095685|nr:hypothetical protein [Paenibacillus pinistramenti]
MRILPSESSGSSKLSGKRRFAAAGLAAALALGLGLVSFGGNAGLIPAASAQSASAQSSSAQSSAASASSAHSNTYKEFEALLGKGRLAQAIAYFKSHRSQVSRQEASVMTLHLENEQLKQLDSCTAKLSDPAVQPQLASLYRSGDSFANMAARTSSKTLKSLLSQAGASGYKPEMAEGMLFPVLDYSQYMDYRAYVSPDIQAYIDIMAEESRLAPAEDGGLVIGYQQIVGRAVAQEHFIKSYPYSNRIGQIRSLFSNYELYTYYGLNNTPLFQYDDKKIQPDASRGYKAALQYRDAAGSDYLTGLAAFMKVVDQNGGKLTAEVEKYRSEHFPAES